MGLTGMKDDVGRRQGKEKPHFSFFPLFSSHRTYSPAALCFLSLAHAPLM